MSYESSNEDDALVDGSGVDHGPIPSSFSTQQSAPALAVSKRLRACLGCRESKLRCKRNEENPHLGCERCLASRRECIIPAPRKRDKKTGKATVAVLEKRIDALLASLKDKRENSENKTPGDLRLDAPQSGEAIPLVGGAGSRTTFQAKLPESFVPTQTPPTVPAFNLPEGLIGGERSRNDKRIPLSFFIPRPPRNDELFQKDVVSQGYVSLEDAERVYHRFITKMLPLFPVILLPEDTTVMSLRRHKPALFLQILAVGSTILGPETQEFLAKEALRGYADRILLRGEKSLDLIQALQLSVVWYHPPGNFEEIRFYQPVSLAAGMCLELGLGQEPRPSVSKFPSIGLPTLHSGPPRGSTAPADTQADGKRAWLVSYFLCGTIAMTTRRPSMLRWGPYMDRCVEFLEGGSNALESDKVLCQWVRGQHISEEICHNFSMDDPSAEVDSVDIKLQYIIRSFEQQLDQWRVQIGGLPQKRKPPKAQGEFQFSAGLTRCMMNPAPLQSHFNIINLYLHEIVLHVGHNINDFRPPFMEETIQPLESTQKDQYLTPMQRNGLASCIISAHNVFDIFLGYDAEMIASLPVFNFVRVAYAAVVLIKIHIRASRPDSDCSGIIDKRDLNTESYLQRLVESLQRLEPGNQGMGSLFYIMLQMLQMWFNWYQKRCQNDAEPSGAEDGFPFKSRSGGDNQEESSSRNDIPTTTAQTPTWPTQVTGPQGSTSGYLQEIGDIMEVDFQALFESDSGLFDTSPGLFFETAMGWFDEFTG